EGLGKARFCWGRGSLIRDRLFHTLGGVTFNLTADYRTIRDSRLATCTWAYFWGKESGVGRALGGEPFESAPRATRSMARLMRSNPCGASTGAESTVTSRRWAAERPSNSCSRSYTFTVSKPACTSPARAFA